MVRPPLLKTVAESGPSLTALIQRSARTRAITDSGSAWAGTTATTRSGAPAGSVTGPKVVSREQPPRSARSVRG